MRIEKSVSSADLQVLSGEREHALTVYVATDPTDSAHGRSMLKSAVDQLLREIRETGAAHNVEEALREQWRAIDESDVWSGLSRSLGVFIDADDAIVYTLHNALDDHAYEGRWFNLGPLLRAALTPQEAYALTLSADGWQLWRATATARVHELSTDPDHPTDVADATNRATVRDRGHVRRLVGDEGKNSLLETYAKRVSEAVDAELPNDDDTPLVVFGVGGLLDMFLAHERRRPVATVQGAADELTADHIDAAVREVLDAHNIERARSGIERIMDGAASGLVATDPAEAARAAVAGAVDTLVYAFDAGIQGDLDLTTGEIEYVDDGHDLLSQIAIVVLSNGGTVLPERSDEDGGLTDAGAPLVAGLRYALT